MRRALQPHTLSGLGWTAMLACPMRSVSRWTRPLLQAAAAGKVCGMEHITKNLVWGLWNEGNLFSLTTDELAHFVSMHNGGQAPSEDVRKKSSLVRQIEEMLSLEQQQAETLASAGREAGEGSGSSVTVTDYDNMDAALDEADEYGDWGPEPGFEQRRKADFLEVSPSRLTERFDALTPRSFQLLHSHVSPDVQLRRVCPNKLPGQSRTAEAFTLGSAPVDEANQHRFRRGFEWCLLNLWNLNLSGEINIGAGKVLYYRHIAKQNRNVLPIWSLQRHLHAQHPYAWFAIATDTNVSAMEQLAASMDMKLTQDATTSYKVMIRRMGQSMDCELNEQLQCSKVNLPWDRFMVTHYVRTTAPDLRFVVRARHPIKKRVADAYLEADILRSTRDSVHAVLSPELGEVTYCCERVMRRWSKRLECGIILQLVETKRTPVIITKAGDEGERLEYEWIAVLPEKAERLNIAKVSDELWSCGGVLAKSLEPGMEDLMIHSLTL